MKRKMKPKWMKALFKRRMIICFCLLLQVAFMVFLLVSGQMYSDIISFVFSAIGVFAALYVLTKKDKPAFKMSWIMQILLFPVYGGLFYIFFNFQTSTKKFRKRVKSIEDRTQKLFELQKNSRDDALAELPQYKSGINYLQNFTGFPVYGNTQTRYFASGEDFFEVLVEELKKAEKYIFIEFFIVQEGKMWDTILDVLKEKASQGVDVRVIYDDMGCFFLLPKNYSEQLREMGIKCSVFNPFRPFLTVVQNNRDHRKIVSIDGKVAFTGGINLADEYINEVEKYGHWRDSAIMLRGDAAWSLTVIFLQMWILCGNPEEEFEKLYPPKSEIKAKGFVQPYADSPLDDENVGEHVYMQIINSAKDYVYICTPYLIIDSDMISALTLAAKSGVDVRIMTPFKWDKKFVHVTTRSYYQELVKAGVKVYEYSPGFVHSKTFVSDDTVATVGTINMDFRSLYLHFECGTVIYENDSVLDVKSDFLKTLENCRRITEKDCKTSVPQRILNEILRLIAPLM